MSWSEKYKRSIDCDNPKGFSQKAHCQGSKKRLKEHDRNRDVLEAPVRKCLDEIIDAMEKYTKEQLEIKMEILREKIKKEKKMRKMR